MKPILFVNLRNYQNKLTSNFEHSKTYTATDVSIYSANEMYLPLSLVEEAFEEIAKREKKTVKQILGINTED